eukprot:TRINITY_DN7545_c0_g2_i2.p1 TRINITY_DN7545_c0_g2~~TRINITY_DN7545_c0_g2_i2.p1  ORF type:complete len:218 (+),score=18.95 TRINITY_DN7545_c0_g2_i2:69-722(+)
MGSENYPPLERAEFHWDVVLRRQEREILGLRLSERDMILLGVEQGSAAMRSGIALSIGKKLTEIDGIRVGSVQDVKAAAGDKMIMTLHFEDAKLTPSPRRGSVENEHVVLPPSPSVEPSTPYGRGRPVPVNEVPPPMGYSMAGPSSPVIDQLHELESRKNAAVANEDFLEAKRLKEEIESFKARHTVTPPSAATSDRQKNRLPRKPPPHPSSNPRLP